jgi:uncharacterized protein with PQ loop repeat
VSPLEFAPIAAAAFAVPQFLPQIRRVLRSGDTSGVSWAWAALTSVNNAAWFAYFFASAYWTALVPAASASTLAGLLAVVLASRGRASRRVAVAGTAWASLLAAVFAAAGLAGLGMLLTGAFMLQVTPSIWTAYRTEHPSGISRGTWLLVLGELTCWFSYGLYRADPRLLVLGATGIAASLLMLARTLHRPIAPAPAAEVA